MKKEEAIELLEDLDGAIEDNQGRDYDEAFRMAIKALKNELVPCEKCIHVKACRKIIILKNRTYKLIKYCSQGVEKKEKKNDA